MCGGGGGNDNDDARKAMTNLFGNNKSVRPHNRPMRYAVLHCIVLRCIALNQCYSTHLAIAQFTLLRIRWLV
jgi:hypothetical protein